MSYIALNKVPDDEARVGTPTRRNLQIRPTQEHENDTLPFEEREQTECVRDPGCVPFLRSPRQDSSLPSGRRKVSVCEYDPVEVGCATLISTLPEREQKNLHVDVTSVYGAIVAVPQFARTAGWPTSMTRLVIRSVMFLTLNICMQCGVLYLISKEEYIMDKYAGQMNLCDFGAHIADCPADVDKCRGPGGTAITPARLYNYDLWSTRLFVKGSLKALFPDKAEEIEKSVDPGEYGVESWSCRVVCIFLFLMALNKDLHGTVNLIRLLYCVPTADEPWIRYRHPEWAPDRAYAKTVNNCEDLDFVELSIAGMPMTWKVVNLLLVALPKMLLYKLTAECGTNFLMETSGIDNLVVNSMALGFILNIDELICDTLMTDNAKYMLSKLKPFPIYDVEAENNLTQEEALARLRRECSESIWKHVNILIPWRLVFIMILSCAFIANYYLQHCNFHQGLWVSRSVFLPRDVTAMSFVNALFPWLFPVPQVEEPYWELPPVTN